MQWHHTRDVPTYLSKVIPLTTIADYSGSSKIIPRLIDLLLDNSFQFFFLLRFFNCENCFFILDPPVPTAVYPLKGKFGTRDLSSHGNPPGVPYNVQLAPGPFGEPNGSYQFSGSSNSYIEFPNNGGLDTKYSLTLLVWVFPENTDGPIFNYGTYYFGVHLWIVNSGSFARLVKISEVYSETPLQKANLKQNSWNYIGTSYDYASGDQKLWIDGKVYDVQNIGTVELSTQGAVRVGALDGDNRFLKGRISCMQVYNKALTEKEVRAVRGLCHQKSLFEVTDL